MKKFLIILLFIVFLNSCDPGWRYYLIKPSLAEIDESYSPKYLYTDDSLIIELTASDFGYGVYIYLSIKTPLDSVRIYPELSYIESSYFPDKKHLPDWQDIGYIGDYLYKGDSLSVSFRYRSFVCYGDKNFLGYYTTGKGDFIFYYDIYGNEKPLIFHFAEEKLKKEAK